ncbi:MAG TPA: DUF1778 domain-containing protein [Isosphaeraceae bacterium]|jgi:uncharacterized protein (DUF1778 family)|nr:DUF1778 domain-containing protein [Isosphaeraceae bacterium]
MSEHTRRSAKLDLRLTPEAKQTIVAAAAAARRSVSEFVLASALERAEETLAERSRFGLDAARWKAFLAALDAPPQDLPRLRRLMNEPGVFDRKTRG